MLNKSVARRYAEAFFSIARETNKIDEYQVELEKIVKAIEEIDSLKVYLSHFLIPAKEKKEVVKKIFAGQVSDITLNFLQMVIDKRREAYLGLICKEYGEMADESRNIKKAELISAREVPDNEVKALADKLSASTGKKVQLQTTIDPTLIGGIKIRIGDQIIDGSVAKKLQMLKVNLKQTKIS